MDAQQLEQAAATVARGGLLMFCGSDPFGPAGAERLAGLLAGSGLVNLELYDCGIGDEGASALAAALPGCSRLASLCLGENSIGHKGAAAVAASLSGCSALTAFSLNFNMIGDQGAMVLAAALPGCTTLARLGLESNSIGDEGAATLAAALSDCAALTQLGLTNNSTVVDRSLSLSIMSHLDVGIGPGYPSGGARNSGMLNRHRGAKPGSMIELHLKPSLD
jgi:hypothetical protein